MTNKILSNTEFADALKKGKGTAYLYVKEYGDKNVKSEVLNAALHAIGYDPQMEGARSEWMMSILALTENPEFYYKAISENFLNTTEFWDVSQLSGMLAIMAQNNYPGARELLYQKYELQQFNENWLIGQDIIKLDGIKGMLRAADIIGKRIRNDTEFWADLIDTNEVFSGETMMEALETEAITNENISAYLNNIKKAEAYRAEHKSPNTISHEEFLKRLESGKKIPIGICRKVARQANQEQILEIYTKMLSETRNEQLICFGWFFQAVKMPDIPCNLFQLAEADDDILKRAFIRAFSLISDASVRNLGLNLLERGKLDGLRLLINNFVESDWKLIEEKLRTVTDPEIAHNCCLDLIQILSKNKNSKAENVLLWIYANSPCSECRNSVVRDLLEIEKLPSEVREECEHDCNEEIRDKFAVNQ